MTLNNRDRAILDSLEMFRVLDRDQLIALHFSDQKQPVVTCNRVMKRLQLLGRVTSNKNVRPYDYFLNPSPIKKDSMKLAHFKQIADFIIDARKYDQKIQFEVEPKVGNKSTIEPDVFMIWNKAPFYVEIQRTQYSKSVMNQKIKRYKDYFFSDSWKKECWQPKDKLVFPYILIITNNRYELEEGLPFVIFQAKNIETFVQKHMQKKK